MLTKAAFLGLSILCFLPSIALAEPVIIGSGDYEGQGWIFQHYRKCVGVTARHVVDREIRQPIVIGKDGSQGQVDRVVYHASLDLAVFSIVGGLAAKCPASVAGDNDSRPTLRRAFEDGRTAVYLRRVPDGLTPVILDIVGVSEGNSTFTLSPRADARDGFVRSDSGGPILIQSNRFGESGLPVGITFEVIEGSGGEQFIEAIFISEARKILETEFLPNERLLGAAANAFSILDFAGKTIDPACGPLNLTKTGQLCGWKVAREDGPPIAVQGKLAASLASVTAVEIVLGAGSDVTGLSVSTKSRDDSDWSTDRYCPTYGQNKIICTISERSISRFRLELEARNLELISVRFVNNVE